MSVDTVCVNPKCKSCGWESDIEYDIMTDTIKVRVRRLGLDANGNIFKRGVIIKLTEEMLCDIPEGCEYPHINPDRIELILEDIQGE